MAINKLSGGSRRRNTPSGSTAVIDRLLEEPVKPSEGIAQRVMNLYGIARGHQFSIKDEYRLR